MSTFILTSITFNLHSFYIGLPSPAYLQLTFILHSTYLQLTNINFRLYIFAGSPKYLLVVTLSSRDGRRQNFGLGRIFKFPLGQKFVHGHIRCEYSFRILNAKQIQIFLKVCIAKFVRQIFEYVFGIKLL